MRTELDDLELTAVSGGRYFVNTTNGKLCFDSRKEIFHITGSCYAAMELMDSLIGKYATNEEYDAACVALLQSRGMIEVIGQKKN